MSNRDNSREQWERDVVERQHNLTPAEITRTSKFRGSGLARTAAPLPIGVRWSYVVIGVVLLALGIGVRIGFDIPALLWIGTGLAAVGLFVLLSSIRWTAT